MEAAAGKAWALLRGSFLAQGSALLAVYELGARTFSHDSPLQTLIASDRVCLQRIKWCLPNALPVYGLVPANSFASVPRLEKMVSDAIRMTPVGVRVLCADSGYGKTCVASQTANDMMKRVAEPDRAHVEGAVYINCSALKLDDLKGAAFAQHIARTLGQACPPSATTPSDIFPKPRNTLSMLDRWFQTGTFLEHETGRIVLFLDQFDHLFLLAETCNNPTSANGQIQSFIVALGEDASRNNNYVVIVGLRDTEKAKLMPTWNNEEKISLVVNNEVNNEAAAFRWTEPELLAVLDKHRKLGSIKNLDEAQGNAMAKAAKGRVSTLLKAMDPYRVSK